MKATLKLQRPEFSDPDDWKICEWGAADDWEICEWGATASLERKYIGIELETDYYNNATERLNKFNQSRENNLFSSRNFRKD